MEWFENVSEVLVFFRCLTEFIYDAFSPRIFLHGSFSLRIFLLTVGPFGCYNFFQKLWNFLFFYHFCRSDLCCWAQNPSFNSFFSRTKLVGMVRFHSHPSYPSHVSFSLISLLKVYLSSQGDNVVFLRFLHFSISHQYLFFVLWIWFALLKTV